MATSPTTARAQLQQNRMSEARNRANTSANRGPVFESQGGRTLASGIPASLIRPQGVQLDENGLYNQPKNEAQERLERQERQRKEQENKRKWLENRVQSMKGLKSYLQPPKEATTSDQTTESFQEEPQLQPLNEQTTQGNPNTVAFISQLRRARQLQKNAVEIQKRAQEAREIIKKAKSVKDVFLTIYQVGSLAESEGAALESVNTSGIFISMYRGIKTIMMPSAAFSDDPEAGQFFKGFLSFLEPSVLKANDITAWITGLHAIYGFIIIGFIFTMIFLAIALIAIMFTTGFGIFNTVTSSLSGIM